MKPSVPVIGLRAEDRLRLVSSAPVEHGDHVMTLQRPDVADVHAVVRRDSSGARIVAIGPSADAVLAKARPTPIPTPRAVEQAPSRSTDQQRQSSAAATMRSELAEYRRACAAAGIEAPKLV
jgi:hypothetical protein